MPHQAWAYLEGKMDIHQHDPVNGYRNCIKNQMVGPKRRYIARSGCTRVRIDQFIHLITEVNTAYISLELQATKIKEASCPAVPTASGLSSQSMRLQMMAAVEMDRAARQRHEAHMYRKVHFPSRLLHLFVPFVLGSCVANTSRDSFDLREHGMQESTRFC